MFTQDIPEENEIGQYYRSENYISHTNTSKGFVNTLYHRVRKITLSQKENLVNTINKGQKGHLLDIGAGTGAFAGHMQKAGWEVTGLEPDQAARNTAFEVNQLRLAPSDRLFELQPNSYDVITMWHVLEHVHQLHAYLDQCKKLLKKGGHLVIAVPNYTSGDAYHYQQFWAAWDVPRHLYHFSPASMQVLTSKHGMKIKKVKPMWFDSFYVSMLSEQYRTGQPNLISGFRQGLSSNFSALFKKNQASSLIYVISLGV